MTSAYSINLNFNNTIPVKTDFTFKQGDKGITLNLATTGLDPTGTTAHIVFKRSNGTSVEAELTGQTGPSYSYTILGNEFEIPGVVVADLKLYNGDTQRVSTASFIFLVTCDTMDGVGGGTGGYSDQLEQLSQEFAETLEEYQDAFGDVGAINPRGEYSALEEYTALDLVSYNGNSYLCREGCTGIAPTNTTYWQVFASGGGGGTDDYEDLENKPSINGVELSGDKSTGDLGIEFNDLDDVDMTGATDGQVPTWDASEQKYKPGTPSGGGDNAKRVDLTSIIATGSTNTTGAQIPNGAYFYLNGVFCRAIADIAVNASFTQNTNYVETNAGAEIKTINSNGFIKDASFFSLAAGNSQDMPIDVSDMKAYDIRIFLIWGIYPTLYTAFGPFIVTVRAGSDPSNKYTSCTDNTITTTISDNNLIIHYPNVWAYSNIIKTEAE